jgi:hypothetical protein
MEKRRKAEDFSVGQEVVCVHPDKFIASMCSYLKNRTGVILKVWPSDAPMDTAMCRNKVSVLWQKRNGRGVEKSMIMHPSDLEPKEIADMRTKMQEPVAAPHTKG